MAIWQISSLFSSGRRKKRSLGIFISPFCHLSFFLCDPAERFLCHRTKFPMTAQKGDNLSLIIVTGCHLVKNSSLVYKCLTFYGQRSECTDLLNHYSLSLIFLETVISWLSIWARTASFASATWRLRMALKILSCSTNNICRFSASLMYSRR